jgi:putative SOS response-associated peptidase YedK
MKDGALFGLAGIWQEWKELASGEWIRTLAIITPRCQRDGDQHPRSDSGDPGGGDYARWLSDEPDLRGLMWPFPAGLMRMWPISTRVNNPENDDPSIVDPIELATNAA